MTLAEYRRDRNDRVTRVRSAHRNMPNSGTSANVPVEGGYVFVLRHSQKLSERVSSVSRGVADEIKSLVYSPNAVHTTLASFRKNGEFQEDEAELAELCKIGREVGSRDHRFELKFNECSATPDSVLTFGPPSDGFFHLSRALVTTAHERGITLDAYKLGHITVARFLESRPGADLEGLLNWIDHLEPLGISSPSLAVGFYRSDPSGFEFQERLRIDL
jgi:hypothetical protein